MYNEGWWHIKKTTVTTVTVTLKVYIFYLKSSISMKYNIHKNPALVFHIDKKHIKLHISPLKASNNVRDMLVYILLPVLKALKSVSEF